MKHISAIFLTIATAIVLTAATARAADEKVPVRLGGVIQGLDAKNHSFTLKSGDKEYRFHVGEDTELIKQYPAKLEQIPDGDLVQAFGSWDEEQAETVFEARGFFVVEHRKTKMKPVFRLNLTIGRLKREGDKMFLMVGERAVPTELADKASVMVRLDMPFAELTEGQSVSCYGIQKKDGKIVPGQLYVSYNSIPWTKSLLSK